MVANLLGSLQDQLIKAQIDAIREDYEHGNISLSLKMKSTQDLRKKGLTPTKALEIAIQQLPNSHYFRGPSPNHHDPDNPNINVYEFLVKLTGTDYYLKFCRYTGGTEVMSIHEREKDADYSWTAINL